MTIEIRKQLAAICILAIPVMMVQLTKSVLSEPGPSKAAAAVVKPIPVKTLDPATVQLMPNEGSLAAAAHIQYLSHQPFGSTPFHYRQQIVAVEVVDESLPDFEVQMIMVIKSGNVATIGGEQYRVGDKLDGSKWVVSAIDGKKQSVTIMDSSTGKTLTNGVY